MNISFHRRTDLALAALRVLGEAGNRVSGPQLAADLGTTSSYLPQVMAPLIRAGWVTSGRGPGGGYQLTSQAHRLHLLDVIQVTEGADAGRRCALRNAPCPDDPPCDVHAVWDQAREVLIEGFETIPVLSQPVEGN